MYRDSAGWTVDVPTGWHVVRFSDSKDGVASAGVQPSNVGLPRPSVVGGYPIQVNGRVLPARGVGFIIATDAGSRLSRDPLAVPPLRHPDGWLAGSGPSGARHLESVWFRGNGKFFIATAKIGSRAPGMALKALAKIIRSLRFAPEGS
jgi:hypothetical protein